MVRNVFGDSIAYALLRLYQITHEIKFKEAACDALAYESSIFSTATENWPDLRSSQPSFMTNWQYGSDQRFTRLINLVETRNLSQRADTSVSRQRRLVSPVL